MDFAKWIGAWMKKHGTTRWSIGIYHVAFEKNNRYHRTVKVLPNEI